MIIITISTRIKNNNNNNDDNINNNDDSINDSTLIDKLPRQPISEPLIHRL